MGRIIVFKSIVFLVMLAPFAGFAKSRPVAQVADSIRRACHIPALAYAVVSPESMPELRVAGVAKINTNLAATEDSRFRIGSNTKAITGLLAALLVKEGRIKWDTKFFDLFPELKAASRHEHHNLTLLDLLTFRTRLYPYTYTYPQPVKDQFTGNDSMQRYQFTQWFLQQPPVPAGRQSNFSNLGYVAAGLMLEKVASKGYRQLVQELGEKLHIHMSFGQPNNTDTLQPWGHDAHLAPEPPQDNYKLNWLLPAGNISMTLPDYAKLVQVFLQGAQGKHSLLSRDEFHKLLFGRPGFSVGWFWERDEHGHPYAYNTGNPGTFLSMVYLYPASGRAYIILANVQSDEAEAGMNVLLNELRYRYGH